MKLFTTHPKKSFLCVLIISCVLAYLTQPLFHGNTSALNTIVTIISILSGFSLVIISQLGDISLLPKGSTIVTKKTRNLLRKKFNGQKYLYALYVASLFFAILTTLTVGATGLLLKVHIGLEYLFIVFSSFCLITSFTLPSIIEEINEFKYEVSIEAGKLEVQEKANEIRESEVQNTKGSKAGN